MTLTRPPDEPRRAPDEPDVDRDEFEREVHSALDHLNDPVHLQTHPLTRFVHLDPAPARHPGGRDRLPSLGRALSQALLDAVDALCPSPAGEGSSLPRSQQILRLRFVEGLEVAEITRRLSVSRSAYYVEQQRAVRAVAALLWERWVGGRDDGAASRPSAGSPRDEPRHNLALQLTSFVGREREIAEVKRLLETARLLTLTGTGGCGKTRLAYRVAADLLASMPEEYPDGVWVVELASLADSELVPQTVAFALGLRDQSGLQVTTRLQDHLKRKRLLIVLDNCEHLLDACAALAEALLRACPEVKVLATSRQVLGIAGETSYIVPPLSLPDVQHLPSVEDLSACESVRLFVERARAVRPTFALTEDNRVAVAEICVRLDGIPLAIELAAARARALSAEQIAQRLDDRFHLLTGGSRTAIPRQQTLRAAIDWSYDLLDEPERVLFGRLAVFSGGWTLEAAEHVCAGEGLAATIEAEDVLDTLTRLVDRSLVLVEVAAGEARYRLLETIRQYATEGLVDAEEAESFRRQHAYYYVELAERLEPELMGTRQRYWMDRLESERDNLRATIQWILANRDFDSGLRLGIALRWFYLFRGPFGEARALGAAVIALPGARESALGPRAILYLAWISSVCGDQVEALRLLEQGSRLATASGDRFAIALAAYYSVWLVNVGRGGRQELLRAREMLEDLGQWTEAFFCDWLMVVKSTSIGEYDEAAAFSDRCLFTARRLGSPALVGVVVSSRAWLSYYSGDLGNAWRLTEESLRYLEEGGYDSFQSPIGAQLTLLRLRGEFEAAYERAERILGLTARLSDITSVGGVECELALIAAAHEDYDLAEHHLARSLAAADAGGAHLSRSYMGIVARARGDLGEARRLLTESLAMSRDLEARFHVALCLSNLGVVALDEGKLDEARERFVESLTLRREMGARTGVATSLECFGGLAALEGEPERALKLLGAGQRLREETGNVAPPVWCKERDPWIERARSALNAEQADAAWAEGQAMSLEEAAEYALADEGLSTDSATD